MSIRKRVVKGKPRYDVLHREGGVQRSKTFDRKRDAEASEAEVVRRKRLGAFGPSEPSTQLAGEYLEEWFRSESHRWTASTRKQRAWVLDRWIDPYIKNQRLCDTAHPQIVAWVSAIRADGCPPTQANHALAVLSSALGHAAQIGKLPANPVLGVRRIPVAVTRPHALTPLQVERIRAAVPSQRDRVFVGLLCLAGLRPGEAFALTWDSVLDDYRLIDKSFTAGELKGTKTGRLRHVDLVAPLRDDLDALRPRDVDAQSLVAPNTKGEHIEIRLWRRRVWNPACASAGVQATPYDGRHTFVSLLAAEGKLPLHVGNQVGHSASKMTDRYSHLFRHGEYVPGTPMATAIYAARAEVGAPGVGGELDGRARRYGHLRLVAS